MLCIDLPKDEPLDLAAMMKAIEWHGTIFYIIIPLAAWCIPYIEAPQIPIFDVKHV